MEQMEQEILQLKEDVNRLRLLVFQTKPTLPRFITADEVMTMLNCGRHTFYRLKNEGILKVYSLKRKMYCKHSEVIEALENGLVKAPEEKVQN